MTPFGSHFLPVGALVKGTSKGGSVQVGPSHRSRSAVLLSYCNEMLTPLAMSTQLMKELHDLAWGQVRSPDYLQEEQVGETSASL